LAALAAAGLAEAGLAALAVDGVAPDFLEDFLTGMLVNERR
jgi:hypothetical protein